MEMQPKISLQPALYLRDAVAAWPGQTSEEWKEEERQERREERDLQLARSFPSRYPFCFAAPWRDSPTPMSNIAIQRAFLRWKRKCTKMQMLMPSRWALGKCKFWYLVTNLQLARIFNDSWKILRLGFFLYFLKLHESLKFLKLNKF